MDIISTIFYTGGPPTGLQEKLISVTIWAQGDGDVVITGNVLFDAKFICENHQIFSIKGKMSK